MGVEVGVGGGEGGSSGSEKSEGKKKKTAAICDKKGIWGNRTPDLLHSWITQSRNHTCARHFHALD